jgi:hypothetical protein
MPEGVAAVALTGACTRQVPADAIEDRFSLTFAARCSVDGNLIRIRLILRTVLGAAVAGYWNHSTREWQAGVATNDFGMTTRWQRYGITTSLPIPQFIGANVVDNMVWQISNGTAGAQIIDLDDFQINDLENSRGHY